MSNKLAILFLAFFFTNCSVSNSYTSFDCDEDYFKISFNELINNNIAFDDKKIELIGTFYFGLEQSSITDDDNPNNQIWIRFDFKEKMLDEKGNNLFDDKRLYKYSGKKVKVRGIFNRKNKGHLGIYDGTIENIQYFGN